MDQIVPLQSENWLAAMNVFIGNCCKVRVLSAFKPARPFLYFRAKKQEETKELQVDVFKDF